MAALIVTPINAKSSMQADAIIYWTETGNAWTNSADHGTLYLGAAPNIPAPETEAPATEAPVTDAPETSAPAAAPATPAAPATGDAIVLLAVIAGTSAIAISKRKHH